MATNYIKDLIDDYCVLDTETTGLSADWDEIIEIGMLKVRNNEIVDKYDQLVKPQREVDDFISELTGITNEMLKDAPNILDVKDEVLNFLGDDVIIGHNTSFDIRFLSNGFNRYKHDDIWVIVSDDKLPNKYMDTMQFARKVYPELDHHRLSDLTEYLNLSNNEHRALSDCVATKELYDNVKATMAERGLGIYDLWKKKSGGKGIDIKSIKPEDVDIDEDNFFYGKHVVFTGKLEKMLRKDAMQIVVNLGGIIDQNVIQKTNYLVLGNNEYNPTLRGKKSSKQKKAEKMKLDGYDIDIIDEQTFYDLLTEYE